MHFKNQEVDYKDSVCPFSFAVGDSSFAKGFYWVSGLESLIYLFVCTTTSTHWMDLLHLQQFLKSKQHESPQETIQALDIVLRDAPSKV
ncbi:hypothetical protein F8388_020719 [Cannabis sativa]|uniref:Uncharacterized protein n=1 Tax=Cannabis sativa TaxID=3483 RepID=A0A7J6G524_CANSA|nr:hypothetical protein F8388_020719 [Cannabis sativa]